MDKLDLLLKDFNSAIERFSKALRKPSVDELVQAGCIQYFEFCFELAWKSIKAAVIDQGLIDCFSPKSCIKQAFALGWIECEQKWLEMLKARNIMAHTYNAKDALKIYGSLPDFLSEFRVLYDNLSPLGEGLMAMNDLRR